MGFMQGRMQYALKTQKQKTYENTRTKSTS